MFSFHYGRNMGTGYREALTLDAIRAIAPSAFAPAPHESRSARYTYIPTSEIIAGLMQEGFQPFKAAQSRCRIEGKADFTKHLIRFRHVDSLATASPEAIPEVVLVNSHDGTSAYKLFAGIFRMVCTNGLIVADSLVGSLSVQHKGNILEQVIDGSFQIVGDTTKALGRVDAFRQLQLTDGEQDAFAESAHSLRFADADGNVKTPITAAQLLFPHRSEDRDENATAWGRPGHDLWRTLNTVQENVIRGGLHGTGYTQNAQTGRPVRRRVTTRAVTGIDQDVKLNRALWMLAERMAELKGAKLAA
jgi:hypothetical protein